MLLPVLLDLKLQNAELWAKLDWYKTCTFAAKELGKTYFKECRNTKCYLICQYK